MKNPYNLEILSPLEYVLKGLKIIENDEYTGVRYLLTAGENNYVRGYHALGMYYAYKKNYAPALHYIFKAYEKGFFDLKEVLYVYINAYEHGFRTNKKQMLDILSRIPSYNTLKDYTLLAYIGIALYIFDKKVESANYLKKAIRKEEGMDAYYYLGLCYRYGYGVEQDIEHSYTCFMMAVDYPSKEAIEKEFSKYKKKGLIKKKWKYKEKYAKK